MKSGIWHITFLNRHLTDTRAYTFAIILSHYKGDWVLVRHHHRSTWEIPAGHVEQGETVYEAAHRELFEETGAKKYEMTCLSSYSGQYNGKTVYGMLFHAEIQEFGPLPKSEIADKKIFPAIPDNLTYPDIQPQFIQYYLNS